MSILSKRSESGQGVASLYCDENALTLYMMNILLEKKLERNTTKKRKQINKKRYIVTL